MYAYELFRPTATSDGEGGSTVVNGRGRVVYGNMRVYDEQTFINMDAREDVRSGDVLVADPDINEYQLRVIRIEKFPGTRKQRAYVEAVDQPASQ